MLMHHIAIAIATAGVPLAASKYVVKYNALGAYKVSQKFYKSSFVVMSITGIVGFLVLYLLAPYIAELTLSRNTHGNSGWTVADITWIIRIISMVVIFIPVLATWRNISRIQIDGTYCSVRSYRANCKNCIYFSR